MCGRATRRNPYAIQKSYAQLSFAKVQDKLTAEKMSQFAIHPMVNKVGVDQPECVEPYEPPQVPHA
jgi:hypothetical protein